jgi:hypothetical protein
MKGKVPFADRVGSAPMGPVAMVVRECPAIPDSSGDRLLTLPNLGPVLWP